MSFLKRLARMESQRQIAEQLMREAHGKLPGPKVTIEAPKEDDATGGLTPRTVLVDSVLPLLQTGNDQAVTLQTIPADQFDRAVPLEVSRPTTLKEVPCESIGSASSIDGAFSQSATLEEIPEEILPATESALSFGKFYKRYFDGLNEPTMGPGAELRGVAPGVYALRDRRALALEQAYEARYGTFESKPGTYDPRHGAFESRRISVAEEFRKIDAHFADVSPEKLFRDLQTCGLRTKETLVDRLARTDADVLKDALIAALKKDPRVDPTGNPAITAFIEKALDGNR